jgi:hypothetical protein
LHSWDFPPNIAALDIGMKRSPQEAEITTQPGHLSHEQPAGNWISAVGEGEASHPKGNLKVPSNSFNGSIRQRVKNVVEPSIQGEVIQAHENPPEWQLGELRSDSGSGKRLNQDPRAAPSRHHLQKRLHLSQRPGHGEENLTGPGFDCQVDLLLTRATQGIDSTEDGRLNQATNPPQVSHAMLVDLRVRKRLPPLLSRSFPVDHNSRHTCLNSCGDKIRVGQEKPQPERGIRFHAFVNTTRIDEPLSPEI